MTLKQQREIVRRFKDGEEIRDLSVGYRRINKGSPAVIYEGEMFNVLRDFLNGKFLLESKPCRTVVRRMSFQTGELIEPRKKGNANERSNLRP